MNDRWLPIRIAGQHLRERLGTRGWSKTTLTQKIEANVPFRWRHGVHYLRSSRGIASINVDAVCREMLK
jgi:hypothetical protein